MALPKEDDVKMQEAESPPGRRHFRHFFRGWLRDPRSMGAVAPSGRALARLIATGVTSTSTVLELGVGTGSLTEALLAKGVQPANLYLVERDPELAAILRKRFVGCHVFAADALALSRELPPGLKYDFVISGLPLLLFSPDQRFELLYEILALLRTGGSYQQFTYGGRCPIDRETRRKLNVDSVLLGIAALNLPPAFVYRLTRSAG
ncbi:MAG: methyltransferase domain-containing protein [Gammaproteobacteria bacterium]